jgi:DNA (cytosine-5)-methyltransferase 1
MAPMAKIAVEIFAGAGGLSEGFKMAGFDMAFAVEADERAGATYRQNHPKTHLHLSRIQDLDPRICLREAGLRRDQVTAVIGGPPCQGFSVSNKRTRNMENPNNHLYVHFFRFVRSIRPDIFVLENVAGLRTHPCSRILDNILNEGEDLGYRSTWRELNAIDYSVPQVRRRVLVVGVRRALGWEWAAPPRTTADQRPVTVRDAISDLPILRPGAFLDYRPYRSSKLTSDFQIRMRRIRTELVQGNLVSRNNPKVIERYKHIPPGRNWQAIPMHLLENYADCSRCHTGIYHRLEWDLPSKVIGNFRKNMLIHPSQNRGLSVREAARLQSFPDDYVFLGSIGFQQQQVADAMPPLLAEAVACGLLDQIRRGEVHAGKSRKARQPSGLARNKQVANQHASRISTGSYNG